MAAKVLTEAGLSVVVLETGSYFDSTLEEYRTQLRWPWESPQRETGTVRPFGDFDTAWGAGKLKVSPISKKILRFK